MKATKKRIFGILLGLALVLGTMPALGMRVHAYDDTVHWSTDQTITEDTEISNGVTLDENVELTIAEGKTLTVNGGIIATEKALTVKGPGKLIVRGEDGPAAMDGDGLPGQNGFTGNLAVYSGAVVAVYGGNGGNGANGHPAGNGGKGGNAVDGDILVDGGSLIAAGGNGGNGGEDSSHQSEGSDGYNGQAITGVINATGAVQSDDMKTWSFVSGNTSDARYVRTAMEKVNVAINVGAGHASLFTADILSNMATVTGASSARLTDNIITLEGIDPTWTEDDLRTSISELIDGLRGEDDWLKHNGELYGDVGYKSIDEYTSMMEVLKDIDPQYGTHKVPVKNNLTYYLLWMKPYKDVKTDNGSPICGKAAEDAIPTPSEGLQLESYWSDPADKEEEVETFKGGKEYVCHMYLYMDRSGDYWKYFFDEDNLKVNVAGGEVVYVDTDTPAQLYVSFKVNVDHDWDEGKVTKQPTTTAEGEKTYTCKVKDCGATKKESIPKLQSGLLMAKMTAKGKKALAISWNKIQGVDGYDVFFTKCNSNEKKTVCKNIKDIKGNKTFKWTKSSLKKGGSYKAYIKAYVMKDGKKTYIKTSPMMHAYTSNGIKRYTNAKSVSVNKTKVALKAGKTFKIKAKVNKVNKYKKLMPKSHTGKLRYVTSDSTVAAVSKSGKITAKGKGSCTVFAFAHNGVSKKIKVTVK